MIRQNGLRKDPCMEPQAHRLECRCDPSAGRKFSTCTAEFVAVCSSTHDESHWQNRTGRDSWQQSTQTKLEMSASSAHARLSLFDLQAAVATPPEHFEEIPEARPKT